MDGEDQVELQKESFESIDGSKLVDIHMLLYTKEKFQISYKTWQELSIRAGKLSSNYSLKQRVRELNKLWNIFEIPGDQTWDSNESEGESNWTNKQDAKG